MRKTPLLLTFLVAGWLVAIGIGLHWLLQYQSQAADQGAAPRDWPRECMIHPAPGRFTLLLFVHPHCPCTRATLGELSWLAPRTQANVDIQVLFVRPPGAADGWERGGLWDKAAAIPGVGLSADEDGREARRFGAETSGLALLYDSWGRRVFRGGITAGRGHAGDNPGRQAILACLANPAEPSAGVQLAPDAGRSAPVFGCPLLEEFP